MDIKCRACLATTDAKMYHPLSSVFPEYMKSNLSVLNLLKIVTLTSVTINNNLPNSICSACLKQLKDCYNFIRQFQKSQSFLEENFGSEIYAEQENIILKVEAAGDQILESVVDQEGHDIFQTVENTRDSNTGAKIAKKTSSEVRKRKEKGRKQSNNRGIRKNKDEVIIMSIEDVLREENERTVHNENSNNTDENIVDLVDNDENVNTDTDSISPRNVEMTPENISKVFIMSVKDVLSSSTKVRVMKPAGVRRKRNKGIITQSAELLKNLERKTATRRARKIKTDEKEGQIFSCDSCEKVYESRKSLNTHKYSVHVPEWREKFKCGICGLQSKTRSSYSHHKRKHKGKLINCDECEKVYLTTTQLKQHKIRNHGNGIPAKYLCNECGKRFKYSNALQYHVVSTHHANDKPYMCRFCGFKCVQKSYIKRHERCHTDERPYKCKFCERTFRGSAELQSHQLTHEGKTKYGCKYCGKGFIQTWNMKVHWLQHAGDYDCEICDRNFIDENVLKFHYYHHHKIRDGNEAGEDTHSNNEQENSESLFYSVSDDRFIDDTSY